MLSKISKMPESRRKQAMKIVAREEWQRCADDVFYWLDPAAHLVPYVYTRDPKPMHQCRLCNDGVVYHFNKRHEHLLIRHSIETTTEAEMKPHFDVLSTIRPFTMMPYFEPIINTWLREQLIALEKSRDMMATWLIVALYTWDTLFHEGRQNIFQSETAQKTRDLVSRANTIYVNMPKWLQGVQKAYSAEGVNRSGTFIVPGLQSEIIGFPQGEDKIRQFHPTGMFSDEAAFNPNAAACFASIKPAIAAGGRYTAISTANNGWFYFLCRDLLEQLA